jgi:predicted small lipoprotein YifL
VKGIVSHRAIALLSVVALTGCPEKETESTPPPATTTAAATQTATTTAAPTADLKPETPTPGVDANAKAALDGQDPKGTAGASLAVAGTKGSFTVPKDWKQAKSGAFQTATSKDDKSRFAATGAKVGEEAKARDEGAKALGYTDCQWSPTPESIKLGKDKIDAQATDGKCKRAGTDAPMIFVTIGGDDPAVAAVGGWDAGSDKEALFEVFRSAKKASGGGGDATGIAVCCSALRQNSKSAPPHQQGAYITAAAACDAVRNDPRGRAALATVRAALMGANVPAACR